MYAPNLTKTTKSCYIIQKKYKKFNNNSSIINNNNTEAQLKL